MTSAAVAVTLAARRAGQRRWTIALRASSPRSSLYTTVVNVIERPDGVKIGACFIAGIVAVSLLSRLARAFELRVTERRAGRPGRPLRARHRPAARSG